MKTQNIMFEAPSGMSSVYWSDMEDGVIRFHLRAPKEVISMVHRLGMNPRVISVFDLAIEGICWESLLLTVFSITDAETTIDLDMMANYYCDLHKWIRDWWQNPLSTTTGDTP